MDAAILFAGGSFLYLIIMFVVIYKNYKELKSQKEQTDWWFNKTIQYSKDSFDQYNFYINEILDLQKQVKELEETNVQLKAQVDEYLRQRVELTLRMLQQ